MFGNLGFAELALIALFIIVFFGAKRIPGLARSVGEGIRLFKRASRGEDEQPEDRNRK
jgi:sec-independent protein translocase protein TatA